MSFRLAVFCPVVKRRAAVLSLCRAFYQLRGIPHELTSFSSYQEVTAAPLTFDAYLLPMTPPPHGQHTPEGLLLAQKLRIKGVHQPIIFVATSPEWAYDAFRVNALQYLPMPLSSNTLYPALERAMTPLHCPIFSLQTPDGIYGLPFHEIEHVECTNHILHFHCHTQATVRSTTLRVPLRTAIAPLLSDPCFLQPHRSYVVNLAAASALSSTEFIMRSGAIVPVSRERYADVKAKYQVFLTQTQDMTHLF